MCIHPWEWLSLHHLHVSAWLLILVGTLCFFLHTGQGVLYMLCARWIGYWEGDSLFLSWVISNFFVVKFGMLLITRVILLNNGHRLRRASCLFTLNAAFQNESTGCCFRLWVLYLVSRHTAPVVASIVDAHIIISVFSVFPLYCWRMIEKGHKYCF